MDAFGKPKARQTAIIDASAFEAFQRPAKKQERTHEGPSATGTGSTGDTEGSTHAPGASLATSRNTASFTYKGVEVVVPLYNPNGRRKNARKAQTLVAKVNIKDLLDIVEQYAGRKQRQTFEGQKGNKKEIESWIAGVEALALGDGSVASKKVPNGVGAKGTTNDRAGLAKQKLAYSSGAHSHTQGGNGFFDSLTADTHLPASQSHVPSRHGQQQHSLSSQDVAPRVKNATTKPAANRVTKNQYPNRQDQNCRAATAMKAAMAFKKAVHESEEDEEEYSEGDEVDSDDEVLGPLNSQEVQKQGEPEEPAHAPLEPQPNSHPAIPLLDLDPDDVDKFAYAIDEPKKKEVTLIQVLPNRSVVQLSIPYSDIPSKPEYGKPQPPPPEPYLKPGKHGYDYEKHAWSWERDPDLVMGVGHQIEPEDWKRLSKGEFDKKYYGYRTGHLWPCGCHRVPPEGESWSEEE